LAQFRSGVDVVEVYASVTDGEGRPLQGLARGDFTVREDGVPQTVTVFAEASFPLSVAVAIDRSWSMAGAPLARAHHAVRTLIDALSPSDQAMLVAISARVETVAPLSTDRDAIIAALERLDAWSTTALHDAIIEAIGLVQSGSGRRALILVSDGADRYSTATPTDVLATVRRADVMVYPVALGRHEPPLFAEVAALSGGRSFTASDGAALDRVMRAVADDLHHQYLLGYAPAPRAAPGGWRPIVVTVGVPGARVRARRGYTAG